MLATAEEDSDPLPPYEPLLSTSLEEVTETIDVPRKYIYEFKHELADNVHTVNLIYSNESGNIDLPAFEKTSDLLLMKIGRELSSIDDLT